MRFIGYSFTPLGLELGYKHWMLLSDRYRSKRSSVVVFIDGEQTILMASGHVYIPLHRKALNA